MKLLEQIEISINKKINKVIRLVKSKVVASKNTKSKDNLSNKQGFKGLAIISQKIKALQSAIISWVMKIIGFFANIKQNIQFILEKIIGFIESVDPKKFKPKLILAFLAGIIIPVLHKTKTFLAGLKPITIVSTVTIATTSTLLGINVYKSAQKVKEKATHREPASIPVAKKDASRPKYYKADERTFRIRNIRVPTPQVKRPAVRSLIMDVTVVASNKYIKQYFEKNMHFIEDKINSNIHPVDPLFPLQDEGKKIMKSKLKSELELLLKELQIEGDIKSVNVDSIIAG